MIIIAGKRKGAKILAPIGQNVRPTLIRCREALFSMLLSEIQTFENKNILDPFAGSGALGLEAWSRGAKNIVFVESNNEHMRILKSNIQKLNAQNESKTILGSTPKVLKSLTGLQFDIVMLDPPYQADLITTTLDALLQHNLLSPNARISIEFDANQPPKIPKGYICIKDKKYGKAGIQLFCKEGDPHDSEENE